MGKAFKSLLGPWNLSLTLFHFCLLIRCVGAMLSDHIGSKGPQRSWIKIPKNHSVSEHQNLTSWLNYHAGSPTQQIPQGTPKFIHNLMHWGSRSKGSWNLGHVNANVFSLVPNVHSSGHWSLREISRDSCKPEPDLTPRFWSVSRTSSREKRTEGRDLSAVTSGEVTKKMG